ncbi:MAG: tetratricopeptide repeat protein [Planctomycetes bacterium]|nr:tetratricopeptide repeat protein [Planctomycetota bacterium]
MSTNAPQRSTGRNVLVGFLILVLGYCAVEVYRKLRPAPGADLAPLPSPDVARLDPLIQDRILEARTAVEQAPFDPAANRHLGMVYHAQALLEAARVCYGRALDLGADDFETHYYLALCLYNLGQLEAAESQAQSAIQMLPTYTPARLLLGRVLWEGHALDRAEPIFAELTRTDPRCAAGFYWLGRIHAKQARTQAAIDAFAAALALVPDNADVHYAMAMAWRDQGDTDRAAEYLKRYQEDRRPRLYDDPYADRLQRLRTGADHAFQLGLRLSESGRFEEAITKYRQALEADPELAEAHQNLGVALMRLGELDAAIEHLRRAVEINPSLPQAHTNLGNALARAGRASEARLSYAEALRLDSQNPAVYNDFGNFLLGAGDFEQAVKQYEQAIRLAPGDLPPRVNLGIALHNQGEPARAAEAFRQALEVKPDDPTLWNYLAQALADAGKFDEAVKELRNALQRRGADPRLQYAFGEMLVRAGRIEELVEPRQVAATAVGANGPELVKGAYDELIRRRQYAPAVKLLRRGVQANPDDIRIIDRLAWLLATAPEDELRDGTEAIGLAEGVCQATDSGYVQPLLTLSAAYAEAGRFDDAAATAENALTLARANQDSAAITEIEEAAARYADRKPLRLDP